MIRACLVGFACWIALGACGLAGAPAVRPVPGSTQVGFVSDPAEHETLVIEGKPFVLGAAVERAPQGAAHAVRRRAAATFAVLNALSALGLGEHDVRRPSRTSAVVSRAVDLRREVLRACPGRRLGSLEAAPRPRA